jgi:CRP-like cAMP-binding protein
VTAVAHAALARAGEGGALFLSEYFSELDAGAGFLDQLDAVDRAALLEIATPAQKRRGDTVFMQGERHSGVWIIETGRVRTFYVGESGREMTLAYWSPGHFVGGPELFGGGRHIWSADVAEAGALRFLPGAQLKALCGQRPAVALALIDGLVAKGKCYSTLVQMLGTRAIPERLRMLLRAMADRCGRHTPDGVVVERTVTQEQLAMMVGATRQWVAVSLQRMRQAGWIEISRDRILLREAFWRDEG